MGLQSLTLAVTILLIIGCGKALPADESNEVQKGSIKASVIKTVSTNMDAKVQPKVRSAFEEVFEQHLEENHCQEWAVAIKGSLKKDFVCFKYKGPSVAGAYAAGGAQFIELSVKDDTDPDYDEIYIGIIVRRLS